ncbi:MAG: hypothetical protein WKF84_10715 [Pyrinomonadaceae bacterium]
MLAISDKVSDLIFSPGRAPQIELLGELQQISIPGLEKLTPVHTASIAKFIIGNQTRANEALGKQVQPTSLSAPQDSPASALISSCSGARTPS